MLIALSLLAYAEPGSHDPVLAQPVPWTISEADHDAVLEQAAGLSSDDAVEITVWAEGPDGAVRPLRDYLPVAAPVPEKQLPRRGGPQPINLPGDVTGALSGKATYLSQCHGWTWYTSLGGFSTQRPDLFETVEDFHNPEGMNQFLTAYLENAGASVYTTKERDYQTNQAIADNDEFQYAEIGSGFEDQGFGFRDRSPWDYGDNPFREGTTRRFPADPNNSARWTPVVPEAGYYAVYVSWKSDGDNSTRAQYVLNHPGGTIERTFDQTRHGSTWQFVENLWLPEGEGGLTVDLTVDSIDSEKWLSADAVRIGGGIGDVRRFSVLSGRPRAYEAAILYTQYNGAPTSIYDPYGDGNGSDPSSRSRWADWEHPSGEDAVYLSWHSNAGGGRGTSTYTWLADVTPEVAGATRFGDLVHEEIVDAITSQWDSSWNDRGRRTAHFSEINPNHNDEMPSALVELAFHDSELDIEFLKHPEFRRDSARAMYRGIVRYFAEKDGTSPVFLPEPPVAVAIRHAENGRLEVSWSEGVSGSPFGDAPDGYIVYTSADGRSWDRGTEVISGLSTQLGTPAGDVVYARVAAVNAGGSSFPSEVVGALRSGDGTTPVVIVAAFERLDVGTLVPTDTPVGFVKRMNLRQMNAFDTTVAHGQAVAAMDWPFETVSDEVFDDMDLTTKGVVIWNAGEESTADESFSTTQQAKLRQFVDGGGKLFVSGSEVLWDLDFRGSDDDRSFASQVLGATMDNDDSGTDLVNGENLLEGVGAMDFGIDAGAPYPVEWPDTLISARQVVARYGNGQVAGVYGPDAFMLGYPFESIGDPVVRAEVMKRVLQGQLPDYVPPVVTEEDTGLVDETGLTSSGGWQRKPLSDVRACGCANPGSAGGLWMLALSAMFLRRRRT